MISSYAWVSGGELPSQRLRSYTFGLAASTGFLVSNLDRSFVPLLIYFADYTQGAWLATYVFRQNKDHSILLTTF